MFYRACLAILMMSIVWPVSLLLNCSMQTAQHDLHISIYQLFGHQGYSGQVLGALMVRRKKNIHRKAAKNMSERGRIRIELNIATGLLVLAMSCIFTLTCYGQIERLATPENAKKLSEMPATSLLALITILSLILTAYLIRLLFGKLLKALDDNAAANTLVAKLLAERPCIRNPKND